MVGVRPWTHVLDVSATLVPRTLAAALYGGMQIFNLRKCPVEKRVHALRDVTVGEELFLDYSLIVDAADENSYGCHCRAPGCRGTMVGSNARVEGHPLSIHSA